LRRARLAGCGHYVPEEQPDQFNAVLLDWLAGLPEQETR
jgi:pimeloyl-ACP methyl ester carboxylesterase